MKALIVGMGKLGYQLAKAMIDENIDVTVIDKNEKVVDEVTNLLDVISVNANALDFKVLREINIGSYELIFAVTKNDEANVILCTMAKKMGCRYAVARVRDPEYYKHLHFIADELNIDLIINPDAVTAQSIEKYLLKKYLLVSDEFVGGKVRLVEFNIGNDEAFVGKKLMDLKGFDNLLVTAITREGESIIPNGQTTLESNDVILVGGEAHEIEEFDKNHSGVIKTQVVNKVMIIGGGKLGYYLGLLLEKSQVNTTIIEMNEQRCLFLKENLPNATIIHGDGTSINLLEEEMISTFDAVVTATGFDETNLLLGLLMKQLGIYKSVAKISRNNYNRILEKMSIDAVFNTNFMTANKILRVLRGKNSLSVNLMLDGRAEFSEVILKPELTIYHKPIKDLNLPEGLLIVALVRENQVFIPNGDTYLKPYDHVVLFCIHDKLGEMKTIFQVGNTRKTLLNQLLWRKK